MVRRLEAAGVDVKFVKIPSRFGYLASGVDWHLWEADLRKLLA